MLTLHPCSASPHGRGRALSRITRQRQAEDRATLSVRSHQSRCEVRAADKDAEDRQPGGQEGGGQSQGGYGPPVTAWWSSRPTEATGDLLALSRCRKRLKCPSGKGGGEGNDNFHFMSIPFETELMSVKANILRTFIWLRKVVGLLWNNHTGFFYFLGKEKDDKWYQTRGAASGDKTTSQTIINPDVRKTASNILTNQDRIQSPVNSSNCCGLLQPSPDFPVQRPI